MHINEVNEIKKLVQGLDGDPRSYSSYKKGEVIKAIYRLLQEVQIQYSASDYDLKMGLRHICFQDGVHQEYTRVEGVKFIRQAVGDMGLRDALTKHDQLIEEIKSEFANPNFKPSKKTKIRLKHRLPKPKKKKKERS